MTKITIGNREIPLFYSVAELADIEQEIGCTAYELKDKVLGLEINEDETSVSFSLMDDPNKIKKMGTLIRILGNAGLEEDGQEADLADKWILRHIPPARMVEYAVQIIKVITDGNTMQYREEEKGPVDEGLEESNAKKQPGS